jgi:hypothetical protein
MYQSLHHLRRRLEVEVKVQVWIREGFRDQERLWKLDLDSRSDFVNGVQKVLDVEGKTSDNGPG